MLITYQITRIINNIITALEKPVKVKGTNSKQFRDYRKLFNTLNVNDKKFIVRQMIYSRARLIKHGLDTKQDVHLEGLGTFEFREDREIFLDKLNKKVEEEGYSKTKDVPNTIKKKLVSEVTEELNDVRLNNYKQRLEINRLKRQKPYPITLRLNIKS